MNWLAPGPAPPRCTASCRRPSATPSRTRPRPGSLGDVVALASWHNDGDDTAAHAGGHSDGNTTVSVNTTNDFTCILLSIKLNHTGTATEDSEVVLVNGDVENSVQTSEYI
jgi:hypothetical protein